MGVEKDIIVEALNVLEPDQDDQWTAEGLPRMDAIEALVGDKSITRKEVTDANPDFCREVAKQLADEAQAAVDEALAAQETEGSNEDGLQEKGQEETAPVTPKPVNPEEAVSSELQEVSEEIEEMLGHQAELQKHIDQLQRKQAALQHKQQKQHTPEADMRARMTFIQSQQEQRAKRHARGRKIIAAIGKDGLSPQSPLDQAMSRKTRRGTQRPQPRTPNQE